MPGRSSSACCFPIVYRWKYERKLIFCQPPSFIDGLGASCSGRRRGVLRVAGKWTYLYRAVDSTGATIDFLLSARRDAPAAKRFLQKALRSPGHPRPRVINVDGNPSYPKVITELKKAGELGRRCRCRPVRYLNKSWSKTTAPSNAGFGPARASALSGQPGAPFKASR